jgi:K+-transporting ATPase A subunit
VKANTLIGSEQVIPLGPVSSQIAIKQPGTNGGGFFSANSAYPFENPALFSNFLEMKVILKEVFNQMIWKVSLMRFYNQWEQLNLSFYQVL